MKTFFILIIFSTIGFTQNFDDPMKFFPAKAGDMWEYFYYDSPYSDTLQVFSTKDSIDEIGTIHLWQTSEFINPPMPPVLLGPNYYKIDTSGNVEGSWASYRGILYKLKAKQGEQWVLKMWDENDYEMIRVDTVFNSYLFGIQTQIKRYRRYNTFDSTFTTGMDRIAYYLGYGFGIVSVMGLEGLGSLSIKGAVIDDVLFGDTTQIITSIFDDEQNKVIDDFKLYQNYPNPFNPNTIINYAIKDAGLVKLKVYDILGREVAILVNELKSAGNYSAEFDGANLTSGIYIYTLQTGNFISSKKMLMIK